MDEHDGEVVVPVIREEVSADAIPVVTGGVRVTKRVESHDEIIEQELRKSRVEVKRVKMDRVVDGPQPTKRVGKTLIIPVVSEVLHVEKQWVVTEEIHVTEIEEREAVQNKVSVNNETAKIERFDDEGNVTPVEENARTRRTIVEPPRIVERTQTPKSDVRKRKIGSPGILDRRRETD
ncbi:MAG TPA: DUF2382 domain-containing protein [Bryobacteraceae bacterium]|jgi:stress response protein YsnF|nr:DUF2382 domain-containing protein [Bryobacteraceae bacterium]